MNLALIYPAKKFLKNKNKHGPSPNVDMALQLQRLLLSLNNI